LQLIIGADGQGIQTLEVIADRFVNNAAGGEEVGLDPLLTPRNAQIVFRSPKPFSSSLPPP